MRKKEQDKNVIEIKEEVQVGDVVLERGDKIKVLDEERIKESGAGTTEINFAYKIAEKYANQSVKKPEFISILLSNAFNDMKDYLWENRDRIPSANQVAKAFGFLENIIAVDYYNELDKRADLITKDD